MPGTEARFSCEHCGKSYKWSPRLAGKKAKCACGQSIVIPESINAPPPELDFDIEEAPVPPPPPFVPRATANTPPLSYEQSTPTASGPEHPIRNIWLPLALLLVGLLTTTMWVQLHGITQGGLIAFAIVLALTAIPVVLVFIAWGLLQAKKLGLTIGAFAIAALKILAIIVATDAGILWVFQYLIWMEIITSNRIRGVLWILALLLACAVFVIKAGSTLLFHHQDDDFVAAGYTLAMIAWGAHFFLFLILFVALAVVARAAQGTRAARAAATSAAATASAAPAASPGAGAATAPATIAPTAADQQISREAYQNLSMREARDWRRMLGLDRKTDDLVEKLYAAGAIKVYVGTRGSRSGKPAALYAELPADPAIRAACDEARQTYLQENRLMAQGTDPPMHRFMVIHLRQ